MPLTRESGFKNINFGVFSQGKRYKNHFGTAVVKAAA
jgi:hypothetical protein